MTFLGVSEDSVDHLSVYYRGQHLDVLDSLVIDGRNIIAQDYHVRQFTLLDATKPFLVARARLESLVTPAISMALELATPKAEK